MNDVIFDATVVVGACCVNTSANRPATQPNALTLPADVAIDAEIDLCMNDGEYSLEARMVVNVPGVARDVGQALVDAAERTCPYTKAIRGNVPFSIALARLD
jgi:lipoyl-dependent peroxiredoxin